MKTITSLLALSLITLITSSAQADLKEYAYRKYVQRQMVKRGLTPEAKSVLQSLPKRFDQRINHSDSSDLRTFKQRYWLDSRFTKGGSVPPENAPVIFVICGEAECSGMDLLGAVSEHARQIGAHLVALEHRYFGKSQPFAEMTTANLKYLTTDFALKDLAAFQAYATQKYKFGGKWVAVGGSYPGNLAAYYRQKYPHLVVGALASSAPVMAKAAFEEYDHHVFKVAGPECSKVIQKVVAKIESDLQDTQKTIAVKSLFDAKEVIDNVDFPYVVADMGAIAIQYGNRDTLCNAIQKASDPVAEYARVGRKLFADFGLTPLQDTPQAMMSTKAEDYSTGIGLRQWTYMVCNEYGYFQVAYHDAKESTRSSQVDLKYHARMCDRVFGIKKPVNISGTNRVFYKPLLNSKTTNIYLTNGSNDPWSNLSITRENGNATNTNLDLALIEGAAHCDDLRAARPGESNSLKEARNRFSTLATKWTQ